MRQRTRSPILTPTSCGRSATSGTLSSQRSGESHEHPDLGNALGAHRGARPRGLSAANGLYSEREESSCPDPRHRLADHSAGPRADSRSDRLCADWFSGAAGTRKRAAHGHRLDEVRRADHVPRRSGPTRRLQGCVRAGRRVTLVVVMPKFRKKPVVIEARRFSGDEDRKSTRLNSSHVKISYAVFCLKKKKKS